MLADFFQSEVEVTPIVIRTESIRAVRIILGQFSSPRRCQSARMPQGIAFAFKRIVRDVELGLVAISQSLAEGVERTK